MSKIFNKKNIYWLLFVAIIIFGAILRCLYYFQNRAFCGDEANLVIPLILHSLKNILFSYEELGELAPPLFFFGEKIVTSLVGISEYSVRFIPLIASLASCGIFAVFLEKFFEKSLPKLLAMFLFAVAAPCIIMAGFYKPYSVEVAVFLFVMLIFGINFSFKDKSFPKCILLSLVHLLCFLTSFQSVFAVFSCLTVHFIYVSIFEKNIKTVGKILTVTFLDLIYLGLYYKFFLYKISNNRHLNHLWATDYSFFPNSYRDIGQLTDYLFVNGSYWSVAEKTAVIAVSVMLLLGLIALIFDVFRERKPKSVFNFLIVSVPIASMLIAGLLHIYPFANRLVLGLLPLFIVIIAKPLDVKGKVSAIVFSVLTFLAVGYYFYTINLYSKINSLWTYEANSLTERDLYKKIGKEINHNQLIYIETASFLTSYVYNYMYKFNDNILSCYYTYVQISTSTDAAKQEETVGKEDVIYTMYDRWSPWEILDAPTRRLRLFIDKHFTCQVIMEGDTYLFSKCTKK